MSALSVLFLYKGMQQRRNVDTITSKMSCVKKATYWGGSDQLIRLCCKNHEWTCSCSGVQLAEWVCAKIEWYIPNQYNGGTAASQDRSKWQDDCAYFLRHA